MIKRFGYLILFMLLVSAVQAQSPYCSKYKHATHQNRLIIEDLRSDTFDIRHTAITLNELNFSNQSIDASARLDVEVLMSGVSSISLDLEGLVVDSVHSLTGQGVSQFDQQGQKLHVDFSTNLNAGDSLSIQVFYHGNPIKDQTGWGGFYFQGGYAWNLGVGFGADPHSYGRVWFPCFDNFIEKSTYEFFVTTDTSRKASCNGLLQSIIDNGNGTHTFHWNQPEKISSYLVNVAVADYAIVQSQINAANGILPVQVHVKPSDTNKLKNSFIHLSDAVLAFEDAYGPYRFSKVGYSLVPFNAGAMEHAANITYPIYAADGTTGSESLMAHELAHMWWGDNVTCQTDGDMWINEGWASFSEFLFEEAVYGRQAYEDAMQADLKYMLQFGHHYEESYRAVSGQPHEYVYGDHVYKKGALVAHNLRAYMGDEKFFETIDAFMEDYKYSAVSSDTLEKFFSEYAQIDLEYFFRDWIFSGGYNVVVLDSFQYNQSSTGFDLSLFLQQKLKGREAFHDNVPVYYRIYDNDGAYEDGAMKLISGQFDEIAVTSSIEPSRIVLYPRNEMAAARTRHSFESLSQGSLPLPNLGWNINVASTQNEDWVVFDHIWSYPDPIKKWDRKPYKMSSYHYYKVYGPGIEGADLSAEFFYNGQGGSATSAYMDIEFLLYHEDSLVLLHRASSTDDWEEYEFASFNPLGGSDNGFGQISLSKVIEGEYVLAVKDQTVLQTQAVSSERLLSVFPNPADDSISVSIAKEGVFRADLFDLKGSLIQSFKARSGINKLDVSQLPSGTYLMKILSTSGDQVGSEKIILH